MKLPRYVDGPQLVKALRILGYEATRQKGSHIRVTTQLDGENHEVVRYHHRLKSVTLNSILKRIAAHHRTTVQALVDLLKLWRKRVVIDLLGGRCYPGGLITLAA